MVKIDIAVAVLTDVVDREIAEVSVAFLGGVDVARSIFIVDVVVVAWNVIIVFSFGDAVGFIFSTVFFLFIDIVDAINAEVLFPMKDAVGITFVTADAFVVN